MKLTKISLLSLSKKIVEFVKEFNVFKSDNDKKIIKINSDIELLNQKLIVNDSEFSTLEKIVKFVKTLSAKILNIENTVIPEINNKIDSKATKVEVENIKSLATKNEQEIQTLALDKVDKTSFSSLESKVSSLEGITSNISDSKVDKNELLNYYNKNETIGKIAEELEKIVASAPGTLDTLKELADAINNDPNFANNIAVELTKKASKEELAILERVLNSNSEEIAIIKGQKFLTIEKVNHGFVFEPVFYTPEGWVKVDVSKEQTAEGIAIKVDDNKFNVFFDGIINIPSGYKDDSGDELSNGEIYSVSKIGIGLVTKNIYSEGIVQSLYKVITENGVKKAFIILDVPFML
ncbi:MAG: hypothetical protein ACRC5S_03030 [Cetobacterium sp.]